VSGIEIFVGDCSQGHKDSIRGGFIKLRATRSIYLYYLCAFGNILFM